MNNIVISAVVMMLVAPCGPSVAVAAEAWVAYPDAGRIVCLPIGATGPGAPSLVAGRGAADSPPALCIGCDGLPAVAWLTRDRDIMASAFDGRRWLPPELVSAATGRHRGIPSIGLCGVAVVAWAESGASGFEDIFYSVRDADGWRSPRRAHEENDVPDIMPGVLAGTGGSFSITWKSFDGERYVERRMGDPAPQTGVRGRNVCNLSMIEGADLPDCAVFSGVDEEGNSSSVSFKEIRDNQEDASAAAEEAIEARATARADSPANTASPVGIIAFGDSITYGVGSSSNGPRTGYPAKLQAILEYNYPGQLFQIVNKGRSGEQTSQGLDRIEEVLSAYPADFILIMEGTNDIYFQVSFQTIQQNLKQMAARAVAHGILPIMATVIPTNPGQRPSQYALTRSFYSGRYVQSLCEKYYLPYADQWNAFCSIPDFGGVLFDHRTTGNHPNDNGYRYVMAPAWCETLAPHLAIPFEARAPVIDLEESTQTLNRGSKEDFSYRLSPSNDFVRNGVDCYIALQTPAGGFFFLNARRQFTRVTTPILQRVQLNDAPPAGSLLELPIGLHDPLGIYTLYMVTVRSFRNPWIAGSRNSMSTISFEVK